MAFYRINETEKKYLRIEATVRIIEYIKSVVPINAINILLAFIAEHIIAKVSVVA